MQMLVREVSNFFSDLFSDLCAHFLLQKHGTGGVPTGVCPLGQPRVWHLLGDAGWDEEDCAPGGRSSAVARHRRGPAHGNPHSEHPQVHYKYLIKGVREEERSSCGPQWLQLSPAAFVI